MLAHHPITGKPIRILRTATHLHKNQKTLAWLTVSPSTLSNPERYARWDTVVTSTTLAEEWNTVFHAYPSAIVLKEPSEANQTWVLTKAPRQSSFLFLSRALMDAIGLEKFRSLGFVNSMCLEEMGEMFPHILRSTSAASTESDKFTLVSIAAFFRVSFFLGIDPALSIEKEFLDYIHLMYNTYKLTVSPLHPPEELWLLQQYYIPEKARRAREIQKCLQKNLENPYIDRILLLNEMDLSGSFPNHPKLTQHVIGHRLRYDDIIDTILTSTPHDTIVAFANADIYFDESWRQLWSIRMQDTFLSLLRYEEAQGGEEPKLFGPRSDSQDTWVIHSDSVKSRKWYLPDLEFEFGRSGCDNAINVEMLRKKFVVANPCMSLRTLHCHGSQYRTYNPREVVNKPMFLYLDPTGLHDLEPKMELGAYRQPSSRLQCQPFSRRIQSVDPKEATTVTRMISRESGESFTADGENLYNPLVKSEEVYQFQNACMTITSLVYGYNAMYVGSEDHIRERWATTEISQITPCLGVASALAVPLDSDISSNVYRYLTEYLSRVFRLMGAGFEGDFWLPRILPRLQEFLGQFKWSKDVLPVLPRDESVAAFAKTVTYLPERKDSVIFKEDIEALRSMLKGYVPTITKHKQITILQDDELLDSDTCSALETLLESKGYTVDVVYVARSSPGYILQRMLGAAYLIAPAGCEALFWMLPPGAKVLELHSELSIHGKGVHMAGAASVEYWCTLVQRAKKETMRSLILDKAKRQVEAWTAIAAAAATVSAEATEQKPVLILPRGFQGLHSHAGDTFREMVESWAEQGKCELRYSTETPFVWWSSVGNTLLYDRPTADWIKQTPVAYKRILVGNPPASDPAFSKAVQWSFWGRHPKRLEQRAVQPLPSWSERTKTLVFYGRIENQTQMVRRHNNLYKACDEFDCPARTVPKYKYSQEEYLDQLSKSKFGLCMAGYGYKCNREIECLALGTVPVVAPDVDMEHYANPPVEGVHYLRLKSFDPHEAKELVEGISEEKWNQMSAAAHQWWAQNASADGLWALTKALVEAP